MISSKRRTTVWGFDSVCPQCWGRECRVPDYQLSLFHGSRCIWPSQLHNTKYKDGSTSLCSDFFMADIEWAVAMGQTWDWVLSMWFPTMLTITTGDGYYWYPHFTEREKLRLREVQHCDYDLTAQKHPLLSNPMATALVCHRAGHMWSHIVNTKDRLNKERRKRGKKKGKERERKKRKRDWLIGFYLMQLYGLVWSCLRYSHFTVNIQM